MNHNPFLRKLVISLSATLISMSMLACNGGGGSSGAPVTTPTLNQQALNFIFVPDFESNPNYNNLSIAGFNHSLVFGQLLTQITAYNLSGIYTLAPYTNLVNGYPDMRSIQSISAYSTLNGYGITATLPNDPNAIANLVEEIIGIASSGVKLNGNYVLALPANLINATLSALSSNLITNPNSSQLYFNFTPIGTSNFNQYIIFSILNAAATSAQTYTERLNFSNNYPQLNLATGAQCIESPITFQTSGPTPVNINTNETVYFVRHVEAHPGSYFDNGNYVCQGQWRAIGNPAILLNKIGGTLPDLVYSSDPSESYASPPFPFSYTRPSLTINPFTIKYNLPLNLVESTQAAWNEPDNMAHFFFTGQTFSNKTILVAWEHGNIQSAVDYLISSIYNQPNQAQNLPQWEYNDYDTIWKVQIDAQGQLTFSNSCEGISTAQLPMYCPTF